MTEAAAFDELLGHQRAFFEVLGAVEGQNGRELLVREGLFGAHRDFLGLADEHLGFLRHGEAGHLGNLPRRLADDLGVEVAIDEDHIGDFLALGRAEDVSAASEELLLDGLIHAVDHDDGLLRGADHAVVKGLGHQDRGDGHLVVSRFVDERRGVARAHAQGRLARRVGRLHHARTAGGEDEVGVLVVHQRGREGHRRLLDAANDPFRGAGADSRALDDHRRFVGGALGTRVRREDDAVTGLEGDERLEDGRGGGVGGRDDTGDDADRLGDAADAVGRVILQLAAGLGILVGVVDEFGGEVVLNNLVFHHTHPGLFDGDLRQFDTVGASRERALAEDLIDLLLRIGGVDGLSLLHALHQRIEFGQLRGFIDHGLGGVHRGRGLCRRLRGGFLSCHTFLLCQDAFGNSV